MRLHFGLPAEALGPAALTIGSFDGVHLGHQEVLSQVVAAAQESGSRPAVVTFEPHPRCILDPANCPKSITTLDEKAALISRAGIDELIVLEFNRQLAALTAEEFMAALTASMDLRRLVVGYDFTFGRGRQGDAGWLEERGYPVRVVSPLELGGEEIHSSEVRRLVTLGEVATANRLLGRSFAVGGVVEPGDRVGHQLGYPTANLAIEPNKLIPGRGIYAGWARVGGADFRAAISIGYRPTFQGTQLRVEAYLLDYDGDLYRQRLEIRFEAWLREEVKYASPDALVAQMALDVEEARRLLVEAHPQAPPA